MKIFFNPVVMAGGVGSRLWPLSRTSFPKQFQHLVDNEHGYTMLQQTFFRLSGLRLRISQVICNQDHRFLAAEQCRSANIDATLVLEPFGRNTAPAVILAALRLLEVGSDDPMLVLSADHAIADQANFQSALLSAHELAITGGLVTLGVEPSFACTGYGYIRYGSQIGAGYKVNRFVEKPDEAKAQEYLNQGNYLWNSGMFIVRPSVLIAEAALHCAELLSSCKLSLEASTNDLDFIRLPDLEFSKCESISLDYAIMEHTENAVVVPIDCGWTDVGDLQSLWQTNKRDSEGNSLHGDAVALNSQHCLVKADNRLVTLLGVNGLAVIETKDAVLVASLSQSQQVKDMVIHLQGRTELINHPQCYRPWGSYDSIDSGPNYLVKRITVNPGCRLSLQRHKHRAEYWAVVDGTAKVHVDGVEHILNANDSIFIPSGALHSLVNETEDPLHLVEVQSGSYLGEDDIESLKDVSGRS